jgi:23S rRNA (guanine2445-N2)-methyltransferase / 23S rRNA (guanine2069-N7)-methyltransferase
VTLTLFATSPRGLEELLAAELTALGAGEVRLQPGGVAFTGSLALAYRVCLWSRLASRVLLELHRGPAADQEQLYATVRRVDWRRHLAVDQTLAVDFTGTNRELVHTQFAAQRVKDAVVDQLRVGDERPSVDRSRPDLRIHAHLRKRSGPEGHDRRDRSDERDEVVIALDLSGESLHRRGYRDSGAAAPIKENLAAALLIRAGWPALAEAGAPLLDPMCGSGTILIEAAWIAGDHAPGLLRDYYGFLGWRGHDAAAWHELLAEAKQRAIAGRPKIPDIRGYDAAPAAVAAALANIEVADLRGKVHVERRALDEQLATPVRADSSAGLVASNLPYGERIEQGADLRPLYKSFGQLLKTQHMGGEAAVLLADRELGHAIGLRARKIHELYNGPIPILLMRFTIAEDAVVVPRDERPRSPGAQSFANRLAKNHERWAAWAAGEDITCYRVYDADIPEYAVAVDLYGEHAHVQEYAPPREIDPDKAEHRLREVMRVVPEILGLQPNRVHLKTRVRSKGGEQYGRRATTGQRIEVREGKCRFLVNFTDYLDTGLFLDHRPTRRMIGELARGKKFLNLFAYTATATVHAARGGASQTTTVDMSPTYCEWARDNLELNGVRGPDHRVITAECRKFMTQEMRRYGLIFLDPPTFSNSKRMAGELDTQRDHVDLIRGAVRLLDRGGLLIFSTNFRRFRLDTEALADLKIEDISRKTIPADFERSPRIHQCWQIRSA